VISILLIEHGDLELKIYKLILEFTGFKLQMFQYLQSVIKH
jgi:hypothetical protein